MTGESQIGKNRIEALADGVFAIAMTLMAFNLQAPDIPPERVGAELLPRLRAMVPGFLTYAMSFSVIGIIWIGHHMQYHYIRHVNRTVLWLNLFLLMFVSLIPFSTAMLRRFGNEPAAIWIYSANLVALGCSNALHWWYTVKGRHLADPNMTDADFRIGLVRILVVPMVALLAVALSFFNPAWSVSSYALILIFYFALMGKTVLPLKRRG